MSAVALRWPRLTWHRREPGHLAQRSFDLMCITVLAVLALHVRHLPWWLSAGLAVVLGVRWWQRRHHAVRAPWYLKLPLIALLTLAIVASYGTIFGRAPGAALAVGLLVLKLLESDSPRDARVGMSVACFVLMAALLFDQGLVSTALVGFSLLPAMAALRSLEPAQSQASVGLLRQLLPGLMLLAASLPLTLLAFVLIPRLNAPLWGAPSQEQASTGLSDEMSPGNMIDLLTDDSPAMRVSFQGPVPAPRQQYFRAFVMWRYDGRTWRYLAGSQQRLETLAYADPVDYTVTLQPTRLHVLPALDVPIAAPVDAQMRGGHELMRAQPVNEVIQYAVRSALRYRLEPELGVRDHRRGLQLPAGYNPQTVALGQQWRARYGGDDEAIVQAALTRFHDGGFSYTLAAPPLGHDAMDDFLFNTRAGFCEHYASAFTVLMRAAGIPARVVTGYQGGYWNALGDYLLVRQSDAHAWSEVWLKGRGWVRVDPTAAVRPDRVSLGAGAAAAGQLPWDQNPWLQNLRNHWDIVNRGWNQGVIGFNALRQRSLLTPLGVDRVSTRALTVMLAVGLGLFIALGLAWAVLRREPLDPTLTSMRRIERKLARAGVARRRHEGPQHYFRRAARALPDHREMLERLMEQFLKLRYVQMRPDDRLGRRFRRDAREFIRQRVVKIQ